MVLIKISILVLALIVTWILSMGVMWELWDKSIRPKWLVWIFHDRLHIHEPEMQNDASFDFNGFKWNGFNVLNTKPKCMYCHKYIYLDENGHWKIL